MARSRSTSRSGLTGRERDEWWARAVEAYPEYATYQTRTSRVIPIFLATPV